MRLVIPVLMIAALAVGAVALFTPGADAQPVGLDTQEAAMPAPVEKVTGLSELPVDAYDTMPADACSVDGHCCGGGGSSCGGGGSCGNGSCGGGK